MMRIWCARCGRSYEVPEGLAGRRARCRDCGHVQPIPEPIGPAPSSAPRTGRRPSPWREHLGDVATEAGRLQGLSLVLLALSATDLFVTYALLRASPRFYESNPVAMWVFRRWNMAGMTLFKFGAIALAIALGEVIERHRPGWGKAVLLVGCAAGAAVV